MRFLALLALSLLVLACKTAPPTGVTRDSKPAPSAAAASAALRLGQPIPTAAALTPLADIAKDPATFKGKTVTTSGTVKAVCQHMGCWMEIADTASEAHIQMAGHSFFVPKNASGRHARVQATVVPSEDDEAECNSEAAKQMGRPVAKVQLEASGVELD